MREEPVPTDDLSSITGLEDKHLRALARLQVTDLRSFADADERDIYKTMANFRPRPSLERISRWQEEARKRLEDPRSRLEEAETDASGWRTVASFAVIFGERRAGDARERRVGAERTEVEPEQEPQVWAGWDFEPVGRWMAGQLDAIDSASTPAQPAAEQAEVTQPVGAKTPGRSQLQLDSAAITDANGTVGVITDGALAADLPSELIAPVRVVLTVSGARPGTVLHAVTRILRPDGSGWNPQDPVVVPRSRQAEFDLSGVAAGRYEMSLIAWAPDATAKPVSVRLPAVTIRSGSG
jgi:hypothetical protein